MTLVPAQTGPAPDAGSATAPPAVTVLGVPLALTDYERTLDWMDATVEAEGRAYVCVAATHTVMQAREDPELRDAVLGATMTLPDGQPLVWALGVLGHRLTSRVYGPELMAQACERSASTGRTMYLYGGRDQGTLVQLALNLRTRYPGVRIVGGYAPPFHELSDEERALVAADINDSGADIVWVGIGVPKQEKWMAQMRDLLDAPVLIGVGAAFDFHADRIPQAPRWLQEIGLEWAYRLYQEPRRLWKRYLRYNPRFVTSFSRELLRLRRAGRPVRLRR
jgi:N-acetylglucosaminyldiphosphoundecaprenol N-acetyl-beta-D-mannosaminyltransferase